MLKLEFIGNLVKDPEVRTVGDGVSVCNFTVAVNGRRKQDGSHDTTFVRVAAWRKLADVCMSYLHKGSKVFISGEQVTARAFRDKDGNPSASLEITCNEMEMLGGTNGDSRNEEESAPAMMPVNDENLPF